MAEGGRNQERFSFKTVQLFKDQSLGIGSYGAVYKAKCDDLICAAKIMHPTLFDPSALHQIAPQREHRLPIRRFEQECAFMSDIRHPNIVQYLGMCRDSTDIRLPVLLMELMDNSMTHFLESSPQPIPYHIAVNICHDVTRALSFLHYNKIVHRDLSSNNVLLRGNILAKVTDFGMARLGDINPHATHFTNTLCPGTDVYMPPEAVQDKAVYSEKIDCFSFGVITLQILTRLFPKPGDRYVDVNDPKYPIPLKMPVLEINRRQNHISQVDPDHPLLPVILECLKDKDNERPSAHQLCERMADLKRVDKYIESTRTVQDNGGAIQSLTSTISSKEVEIQQLLQEREQNREQLQRKETEVVRVNEQLQEKDRQLGRVNQQLQEAEQAVIQFERRVAELEQLVSRRDKQIPKASSGGGKLSNIKLNWRGRKKAPHGKSTVLQGGLDPVEPIAEVPPPELAELPPEAEPIEEKPPEPETLELEPETPDQIHKKVLVDLRNHEADRLQPINIEYFGEYVKYMHERGDKRFEREYESLPNDTTIPATAAAQNKMKNRFANIHAYDFSRVKLSTIEDVEGSEYINASYIDGYNRANAYIAAQGPMPNTLGDFWRMVWEHRLSTIVMITKVTEGGRRKCERYWPDNVHDVYNPPDTSLSVRYEELQVLADFEIKKLVVTNPTDRQSSPLTVTHYQFLGWPDHGVPKFATSFIAFIRRVRSKYTKGTPPMLVHCSAGVSRTGVFIVLDTMLERMQHDTSVSIYEFVRSMRAKRIHMVQSQAQYVFIHDALDEFITCGDTSVASHDLRIKIGHLGKIVPGKIITGFQHQFERLDEVSRRITDRDCSDAIQHYNNAKNRYPDRVPFNTNRVRLRPTGVTGAEYINASFVDGHKKRNAYIAAQAPLENTVNDFWRMIWEFKSKCIVMLCDLNEHGMESSYGYWPTSEYTHTHYGNVIVTLKSEKQEKEFVIRKFEITENKTQASFTVTQFHFSGWEEQGRPDAATGVLQMSESVNSVQRSTGNKPITVICNDGIGRTGTFICIHAQLERVKTEGLVDVFQFVKSSRISRPNFLSELEYYIFCHHTLADFLDTLD